MISTQYAAGFVDGEGAIMVTKYRPKAVQKNQYQLNVAVSQIEPNILYLLKERWGGGVYKRKLYKGPNKQAWEWRLNGKDALEFLKDVYPFLIVKKEQAYVGMKWNSVDHGKRLSEGERKNRMQMYAVLRELKKAA